MKKIVMIALLPIVFVTIFIVTNLKAELPEELLMFTQNTNDDYYWVVDDAKESIYVMIYYKNYYKSYSIGLFQGEISNYNDFKELIYSVDFKDSRKKNSMISWMRIGKKENPLIGPKKYKTVPYTAYNIKDYFNSKSNNLAVSLKKIYNYEKVGKPITEGWINYSASYNLKGAQGGLPIPTKAYQGDLIIMLNEDYTKMNEIYISDGEWVYIRHIEKGEYPRIIDDGDLDSILENIWWGLENIIRPLESKLVN